MKQFAITIVLVCFIMIFGSPLISSAETQDVIINELAWAGSSANSFDEWIELKNTTNEDIDLTGWQLTKQTPSDDKAFMLEILENLDNPEANIIQANDYFLIANNSADHDFNGKESVLNIEPNYITSSVSLSNSTLHIRLYNSLEKLVDEAGNGEDPLAGKNTTKLSMERNEIWNDGKLEENWHSATTAINLDSTAPDIATPKSSNSEPPLEPPELIKIDPDESEIDVIWEVDEIIGENFSLTGTTQIKLERNSQAIWANDFDIISPTTIIDIEFDLTNAEVGNWDLIIINPNGQTDILFDVVMLWEEEEEPEIVWDLSTKVILNELYPSPLSGEEEFIELYNSSDYSINLIGWSLDDKSPGGSSDYLIDYDLIIGSRQYLVLSKSQTKIALNNSGDYVQLIQPNGNVLEITPDYGKAPVGSAYAKIDGNWHWTESVTRGHENKLTGNEDINNENFGSIIFGEETDSDNKPWEVVIELDGKVTDHTINLFWEINLPGALGALEIFMSDDKDDLGEKIANLSVRKTNYEITDLEPNTSYYFRIISAYNTEDIKSNQIKLITKKNVGTPQATVIGFLQQIIITELLPKPKAGKFEFIELYNPTEKPVNVVGWKIEDASGKSYILNSLDLLLQTLTNKKNELIIEPGEHLLLSYEITKIRLNNTGGDEIILLDGEENIIDEVTYTETAKTGLAYVLAPNGKWFWTDEQTPGQDNDITFAGVLGDSSKYLVDTGINWRLGFYWLLVIFFGIISYYSYKHARNI